MKQNEIAVKAFRKGLRKIDEAGINRIMSHGKDGLIIISANRGEISASDPNCDLSAEYEHYCRGNNIDIENVKEADAWLSRRNKKCDKELADALKSSPFAFSVVFGGYKGEDAVDNFEPSYIVYNHVKGGGKGDHLDFEKLKEFGIELAKRFKQESVYVQGPDEAPMYVDQNGEQVNSGASKNFKFSLDEEELFTTEGPGGLKTVPQRFTADLWFESKYPYRKAGPSDYFNRIKRTKAGEVFLDD
ncbi:MAG: hypothetical protein IK053_07365 [Muribaculaceae bacterium]|nr:hypothetical protein [Muribaculaceae bacterium]